MFKKQEPNKGPEEEMQNNHPRAQFDKLKNAYNADRQVVQGLRSLDQFYYTSARNLEERNGNQVTTRVLTLEKQGNGNKKENGDWWPILAVGQLWLWVIDES